MLRAQIKLGNCGTLGTPAGDVTFRSPPLEAAEAIVAQTVGRKERLVIRLVLRQMGGNCRTSGGCEDESTSLPSVVGCHKLVLKWFRPAGTTHGPLRSALRIVMGVRGIYGVSYRGANVGPH
jgi:hypothetical protein